MTATEILRKEVKCYIDGADEQSLKKVQAIFIENEDQDEKQAEENWEELPGELQKMLDDAMREGEEGKVTSHAVILDKYKEWFGK